MRVLKLTPFFHHPDTESWPVEYDAVGGMQIQTWRQATLLASKGIHQHVMTIGFPGLPNKRNLEECLLIERMLLPMPRIRSELTGMVGLTQSWALAALAALIKRRANHDFDVIHIHLDGQIPALLVACIAPKLLRCPSIVTVHCSRLAVYKPHSWIDRLLHHPARWLEKKALSAANTAVTLTKSTACQVKCSARNIEIIPDIVDTGQFSPAARERIAGFRKKYGLGAQTVGFVGRIASEKGWNHLIPLALALREQNCGVLIVGDGTQCKRLETAIDDNKLQRWVTITGFIPNDQVPVAMACCRMIVMPSAYEEFGGTCIEALATGVPVVAFAVGGLPEILTEITPDLLVEPGNTLELIARVEAVLAGDHSQSVEPGRLRSYVERRYAPSVMTDRILKLYKFAVSDFERATKSDV